MTLTPGVAKSIVEKIIGTEPVFSRKGERKGQHIKKAYRFVHNGTLARHISIVSKLTEEGITVYVNKISVKGIVFPKEKLKYLRVKEEYPKGSRGKKSNKGLSTAAGGLPTLDPSDNDVMRLSVSTEDTFRDLIDWYFGNPLAERNESASFDSGSDISVFPTKVDSSNNEASEEHFDEDIDSVSKLEYPIEDIQQRAIKTRRGQPDFRKRIFAAYGDKCAITGCEIQSVLEAAHIVPHADETNYGTSNGLPLRADIHTLFDLRLLAVSEDYRIKIHTILAGSEYEKFHGKTIGLPKNKCDYPALENLAKHFEGFVERGYKE